MAEEQIEEASMAIAGRGASWRSRSKRRPWPRRRPRRSSSSSTSPSRSRIREGVRKEGAQKSGQKYLSESDLQNADGHPEIDLAFVLLLPRRSLIKMAEWNPEKDLLAMVTDDSKVLLHRFNWQRLWTISLGKCITSICWSPDGKIIALGT
ncbi:uncharacterized protein [Zea mays]|uniref:Anaphase-promoting complex subunit 4 n=1 Tax=Zea mays TaxID=4577 RepID=A0A1D6NT76_MAIZE|nr:uncharacterized protein LOC103637954 isoform X3 [Zea mays]AQL01423.1 Anaphase-promoting complex subunit 4 [Zea mays]|eukprot:XP_008659176.1 uncharacterized protein LOC103637954 isoform X2 [Zea mays]